MLKDWVAHLAVKDRNEKVLVQIAKRSQMLWTEVREMVEALVAGDVHSATANAARIVEYQGDSTCLERMMQDVADQERDTVNHRMGAASMWKHIINGTISNKQYKLGRHDNVKDVPDDALA